MNIILIIFLLAKSSLVYADAVSNWGNIQKKLSIFPGLNTSCWLDRGTLTNMTPVGDGTYEVKLILTPGQSYNFMFFAETDSNPEVGLNPNYTYYDQIPGWGSIPTSRFSNSIEFPTNYAQFGPVGEQKDSRRIVYVPDIGLGTNFYIFNNFSQNPGPPDKVNAIPGNSTVILEWNYAKGNWGIDNADVIAGGNYYIYYNNTSATNNYTLLTNVAGNITKFTHNGLVNGTTYYYILVSSDAYTTNGTTPITNLKSPLPEPFATTNYATVQSEATPRASIPVYFKVEGINWDVVEKSDYLVWLTPSDADGRFFYNKVPGRIVKVVISYK